MATEIIQEVYAIGENLESLTEGLSAADKEAIGELTHDVILKLLNQRANDTVLDALSKMALDDISSQRPRVGSFHNSNSDEEG